MGGTIIMVLLGLLVFAVVGGIAFAAYTYLNPTRTASDRLAEFSSDGTGPSSFIKEEEDDAAAAIASRLGSLAASQDEEEQDRMRRRLFQAGYKSKHALEMFNGIRVTLALCLPLLVAPFAGRFSTMTVAGLVLGAALVGYYMPHALVENRVTKRQAVLLKSFPDALDMLVSSVEAGLGLDAAFRRVAAEMAPSAPDLAAEFQVVNHEISAGVSRVDALRHLEQRTGLDEIRSLVNMLTQAERFGTSIARSLRVHSRITREKRMSRAEEEAAKVSPKLTVIMILFLLPCLVIVLLGPAVVRIKNNFIDE